MQFKGLFVFIFIIILLGILSIYYDFITGKIIKENKQKYEIEPAFVLQVVDGDTIKTDKGEIRFLGINTPEKNQPYYNEAKLFLKEIENKSVELLRDYENLDKYDRKLRYVFYENSFLNIEILEQGLGTSFMLDDLNYESKLKNAEEFAKKSKINLWQKSSDKCADCIKLVELNEVDEYFIIQNTCNFDCDLNNWIVKDDANHFFNLKKIEVGEIRRVDSKTNIWNNAGDRFFMRDDKGGLVVFWEY